MPTPQEVGDTPAVVPRIEFQAGALAPGALLLLAVRRLAPPEPRAAAAGRKLQGEDVILLRSLDGIGGNGGIERDELPAVPNGERE